MNEYLTYSIDLSAYTYKGKSNALYDYLHIVRIAKEQNKNIRLTAYRTYYGIIFCVQLLAPFQ